MRVFISTRTRMCIYVPVCVYLYKLNGTASFYDSSLIFLSLVSEQTWLVLIYLITPVQEGMRGRYIPLLD